MASTGGIVTMVLVHYVRGLLWQHAFIIGLAGAGLVYWTLRAVENLRRM
jgi:hypothetical protein